MASVALVTGTSTGIGLSAAVLLAEAGFTVVATMRDLSKSAALQARAEEAGARLDIRQLDVQSDASVQNCIRSVLSDYGSLGVVVNNAGLGFLGTLEQTPFADLQRTIDINFFGVWRVVQAALPAMRANGSGRIITISSIGGLIGQPFNDAYCAAKFAVEGMMESLAPVARKFGIYLSLIEPGPVNTEFVANVLKTVKEAPPEIHEAYAPLLDAYIKGTQQAFATMGQTGDDIGKIIVEAATTAAPQFRYLTSDLAQSLVSRKYVDTTGDSVVAISGSRLQ